MVNAFFASQVGSLIVGHTARYCDLSVHQAVAAVGGYGMD